MPKAHAALSQDIQDTVQGFAQSAARHSHAAQPDVKVQNAKASWLVGTVDLAHQPTNVLLTFKGLEQAGLHTVQLALPEQALRQWLGVVLDQYRKADWLVGSVDLAHQPTNVLLTFKSAEEVALHTVQLALPEQALRQWLGVVLDQYRKADWPTAHWPAWMTAKPQANPQTSAMTLH